MKNETRLALSPGLLTLILFGLTLMFDGHQVIAQKDNDIFMVVEDPPTYPGGDTARIQFLQQNIIYPKNARETNIQGIVYVTFVIEKDGAVNDVKVLKGIGGGCDEETIRVVGAMPKWKPGYHRGKPVRVQYNMPVKFTLAN